MVREGKGKKDRMVPLGNRACRWIDHYTDEVRPSLVVEPDQGWLYLHESGEPPAQESAYGSGQKYIAQAASTSPAPVISCVTPWLR